MGIKLPLPHVEDDGTESRAGTMMMMLLGASGDDFHVRTLCAYSYICVVAAKDLPKD